MVAIDHLTILTFGHIFGLPNDLHQSLVCMVEIKAGFQHGYSLLPHYISGMDQSYLRAGNYSLPLDEDNLKDKMMQLRNFERSNIRTK